MGDWRPDAEGFVRVSGGRLFFRSFGRPEKGTLLGLHGGPGASHDYLLPWSDLRQDGYRVVLFDQLGCGRSDVPAGLDLFTLDHNVEETEQLRDALGLGAVHLVGSSYGGLLALAYALAYPRSLRSLTTVGGLASVPFAVQEMNRLRRTLPSKTVEILDEGDRTGDVGSLAYQAAVQTFYRQFLCRLDPWPTEFVASMDLLGQRPVYAHMNGPNEFTITGTIRDIDLTSRLPEIRTPTLVLGGKFDEITPAVAEQIRAGIPGARRVEFAGSSHVPFWEESESFRRTLQTFLGSVDGAGPAPVQ